MTLYGNILYLPYKKLNVPFFRKKVQFKLNVNPGRNIYLEFKNQRNIFISLKDISVIRRKKYNFIFIISRVKLLNINRLRTKNDSKTNISFALTLINVSYNVIHHL